jgi:soluble lytic murein transglycosylase-like protein
MVRVIWITAIALTVAAPASAQDVDWRRAGGGLFGTPVVEPAVAAALDGAAVPRLASLNQPFQDAIDAAALAHGLDPKLLHALVITESAYRADARSPVGAGGLTQLMPGTALELGVRDRFDPIENLRGGADYLARQILRFGDLRLALAAYNSGPGRVARLGRIPDIAETQAYVASVVDCYLALTAGQGVTNSRQCRPRGAGR